MPTTVEETPTETKAKPMTVKEARINELLQELDGKSETTQRPVIDEIVALGSAAIKPLSKALGSGASFQVRMASATGLGELNSEKCVVPLVAALGDSSLNVQRAAVTALTNLGEPSVAPLVESLDSEDDVVRRWSAEVLGRLNRTEIAPSLIEKLPDETLEVQKSIVIALGELKEKDAAPVLLPFLNSDNLDLVRFTAESLGQIGDQRAVDPLIDVLNSPSVEVRKVVAGALVQIGKEAVPSLTAGAQPSQP